MAGPQRRPKIIEKIFLREKRSNFFNESFEKTSDLPKLQKRPAKRKRASQLNLDEMSYFISNYQ